mgnify:FL=1
MNPTSNANHPRNHRPDAGRTPDPEAWARRARLAHRTLRRYFRAGRVLLHEAVPRRRQDRRHSYEWPHSQVTAAATDLACVGIGLATAHDAGQETYWSPLRGAYTSLPRPPHGVGGRIYIDDNAWMALIHVQRVLAGIGSDKDLRRAQAIHRFIQRSRDTDPSHPAPGGVFWMAQPIWATLLSHCRSGDGSGRGDSRLRAASGMRVGSALSGGLFRASHLLGASASGNHSCNTVSTMPPTQLALRLHQVTGEDRFLRDARPIYEWAREHMLSPDGLFWDNIDLAGNIDPTFWSYNQGVPIGVEALAWQITGSVVHRRRFDEIIEASLAYFRPEEPDGPFDGQPIFFNAIFLKNLLLASAIIPDDRAVRITQCYAERMWRTRCDQDSGLYRRPSADHTELLEQAAMVQLCAVLAADPRCWAWLY